MWLSPVSSAADLSHCELSRLVGGTRLVFVSATSHCDSSYNGKTIATGIRHTVTGENFDLNDICKTPDPNT